MLGRFVKVKVTSPMFSHNKHFDYDYNLNYGIIESGAKVRSGVQHAYIMGITHPVKSFNGRVIAVIRRYGGKGVVWIVAPKSSRYIVNDIKDAVAFAENPQNYDIECLYECSCGTVTFRDDTEKKQVLLIKNKRSSYWGYPKGHVEKGELQTETALRETKEETGLNVEIIDGFVAKSEFKIQNKIEKTVYIYLARAVNTDVKIQEEEIDKYIWVDLDEAMKLLKFDNDKNILSKAIAFINANNND